MRALVKEEPERGLRLSDESICGADVHIFNWDEWAQRTIVFATVAPDTVRCDAPAV
jgi:threonine dehydrogenase-like Zn-dependent dehydrogenase